MGFRQNRLERFGQPTDIAATPAVQEQQRLGDVFIPEGPARGVVEATPQTSAIQVEAPGQDRVPATDDFNAFLETVTGPPEGAPEGDEFGALLEAISADPEAGLPLGEPATFGERAGAGVARSLSRASLILQNQFGLETRIGPDANGKEVVLFRRGPEEQFQLLDPDSPFLSFETLKDMFADPSGEIAEVLIDIGAFAGAQVAGVGPVAALGAAGGAAAVGSTARSALEAQLADQPLDLSEASEEAAVAAAFGVAGEGVAQGINLMMRGAQILPRFGKAAAAPERARFDATPGAAEFLDLLKKSGNVEILDDIGRSQLAPISSALEVLPDSPRLREMAVGISDAPVYVRWRRAVKETLDTRLNEVLQRTAGVADPVAIAQKDASYLKSLRNNLRSKIRTSRQAIMSEAPKELVDVSRTIDKFKSLLNRKGIDSTRWLLLDVPSGKLKISDPQLARKSLGLKSVSNAQSFVDELNSFRSAQGKGGMNFPEFMANLEDFGKSFDVAEAKELNALWKQVYHDAAIDSRNHVQRLSNEGLLNPDIADDYIGAVSRFSTSVDDIDQLVNLAEANPQTFGQSVMDMLKVDIGNAPQLKYLFKDHPHMMDDIFKGWVESKIGKLTKHLPDAELPAEALESEIRQLGKPTLNVFFTEAEQNKLFSTLKVIERFQKTQARAPIAKTNVLLSRLAQLKSPFIHARLNSVMTIKSLFNKNKRALEFLSEEGLRRNTEGLPLGRTQQRSVEFFKRLTDTNLETVPVLARALRVGAQNTPSARQAAFEILEESGLFPLEFLNQLRDPFASPETIAPRGEQVEGP